MDINKGLSEANRLLQRKIPHSSHLLKPEKTWMHTVPTKDCDVVMVMAPGTQDSTIQGLLTRIKTYLPQLNVSVKNHDADKAYVFYLHATYDGLLKAGEEMRLVKRTKPQYGGDLRELSREEISIFQDSEDEGAFFTTQERQSIVQHFLNSLRATHKESIEKASFRQEQAIVPKLLSKGIIRNILPLHQYDKLKALKSKWVTTVFERQPLDQIEQYFGSRIAIYFAWLGHYTAALTIPALLGLIFWTMEDKGLVAFAFLNVVWASTWLEAWKRRSAELSFTWGTLDSHLETFSEPRPRFKGELRVCSVTGRLEPHYPTWKRNLTRYFVTLPLILSSIFIVFIVMLIMLRFQDVCNDYLSSRDRLAFLSFAPKALMALPISLFDKWYTKLAHRLNDKENYRSEEAYQNHLIIKLLVFRFVNSFLSLFYIAFYLQDLARLKEQLAALLLTRQLTGNLKESVLPYLKKHFQLAKLSFDLFGALKEPKENDSKKPFIQEAPTHGTSGDLKKETPEGQDSFSNRDSSNEGRNIAQAEVECNMARYDGTFKDYLEMFIQFGYVTLFSSVFPLAALFALVSNVIEIRSDAFKLCYVFQRPFGSRANGIGVWQDAMELMGVVSIIVNCALIGLSGQLQTIYPDISTNQTILFIIVLEHCLIGLKYGISYAIPDIPEWVERQLAKIEFKKRETLKGTSAVPTTTGTHLPS